MINVTCPCCGGHLGELPEPDRVRKCLSPQELKAFDVLMAAGPEGMDKIDLSIALFGKPGTSERKLSHTAQIVTRLRNKLDRYGYFIKRNAPIKRGFYRIIPLETSV